jgi:ABC-type transport system involved in cytochrome c biogenesis permease subunit
VNSALQSLLVLLPVGYVLSAILHGMVFGGPRAPQVSGLRRFALRATLVLHFAYFALRAVALDHFPVSDLWSTVSAVAFSTALLYAVLARYMKHPGTGGIVLGLVFVVQVLASSMSPIAPVPRAGGMGVFQVLHVATSVLAAASLVLSGIHGILYLLLFREMRERRFGALFDHLPNLDVLARMTRRAALFGFIGLTIGLNLGIWIAHRDHLPGFAYRDPEVLLSLALWIHFGVIAFSASIKGFGARRASFAAAGGLVALLLSLLLVLFPNLSFHHGL